MFGDRVRQAREFCGMTQSELAEKSGLRQSAIAQIEAGAFTPSDAVKVIGFCVTVGGVAVCLAAHTPELAKVKSRKPVKTFSIFSLDMLGSSLLKDAYGYRLEHLRA